MDKYGCGYVAQIPAVPFGPIIWRTPPSNAFNASKNKVIKLTYFVFRMDEARGENAWSLSVFSRFLLTGLTLRKHF